jgi:hypothetical protein
MTDDILARIDAVLAAEARRVADTARELHNQAVNRHNQSIRKPDLITPETLRGACPPGLLAPRPFLGPALGESMRDVLAGASAASGSLGPLFGMPVVTSPYLPPDSISMADIQRLAREHPPPPQPILLVRPAPPPPRPWWRRLLDRLRHPLNRKDRR